MAFFWAQQTKNGIKYRVFRKKKYKFGVDLSSNIPCTFQNNVKLCTLPSHIYR